MKYTQYLNQILLALCCNILHGHGFQANTVVHCKKKNIAIERAGNTALDHKDSVISFDISRVLEEFEPEVRTAQSRSNCYFKIRFDEQSCNDIQCTPYQEFYVPLQENWVPAFKLKQGDMLFSRTRGLIEVRKLIFFEQPLDVYSIEIKKNHNYFVGHYGILTHNMIVPTIFIMSTGTAFGSGAAAGSALSGCFGPIAAMGGAALGGIIGVVIKKIVKKNKVPTYDLCFDIDKIKHERNRTFDVKSTEVDPHGAQAPGKPTENDGFIPKKNWDGKKVRNPNGRGYGWPDDEGNVWVPSGPNGHGCPHWDVQLPNGDHRNIVPGGRVRGK